MESLIPFVVIVGVLAVIFGGAFGYAMYWRTTVGPRLWAEFLGRTGYRRLQAPNAPLDEQARQILQDIWPVNGVVRRGPWVRDVGGMPVVFQGSISTHTEGGRQVTSFSESWLLTLPGPATFGLQVVDRAVVDPSMGARLGQAMSRTSRSYTPRFNHLPATGVPAIDQRFVVYSTDPNRCYGLLSDPKLQAMLFGFPEIDLRVEGNQVAFEDPSGKLRREVLGLGTVSPTSMLQQEPAVHERPVALLRHVGWLVTGR